MPRFNPKIAFGKDAIMRYPKQTPPRNLKLKFVSDARSRKFERAHELMNEVSKRAIREYESFGGVKFEPLNLGESREIARDAFWGDREFKEALVLLGLNPDLGYEAKFPWWNQLAADEISHELTDGGALVTVRYRHSLQTQYLSSGVEIDGPPQNVSVSALLQTSDDQYAIALRGGEKFPNVYHVIASALGLPPQLRDGNLSVYDFYLNHILKPETGITEEMISQASLLSRISDWTGTDPMYNFLVTLNLSSEQLSNLLSRHRESSLLLRRIKYKRYEFIPANPEAVIGFLQKFYIGMLDENNTGRREKDRRIVHPGATALLSALSEEDGPISILQEAYRPGPH